MVTLTQANLAVLPAGVPRPEYDRSQVSVGIVHIGVGGFHRAHQAMYLDLLLNQGSALDWGICGVGVLPADRRMAAALAAQDCLYTLVLKHPDGSLQPRVIGSLVEYLLAVDDPDTVIERMAAPRTRMVTLTITEGGYDIRNATGPVDPTSADGRAPQPGGPSVTAFSLVTAALARRRARGLPPFAVVSCDNIEGNGDVARDNFTAFATLVDADLGAWVEREVRFPNSMVDRITPGTTDRDRAELLHQFGVEDRWPVVCEPFTQWVLEDGFETRPPLDQVGVQLVAEVRPYELMKLRLLNAGHQALAYFACLAGHRFVHEACQDPLIAAFLRAYMDEEASPTLEPVPGIDLQQYKGTLIDRFCNEQVQDTLARLCADTSDRIPKWLLPVIRHNLKHGGSVDLSAAVVASWARYAQGHDDQGRPVEVVDRLSGQLMEAARAEPSDPLAFLRAPHLFGNLAEEPRFTSAYARALDLLSDRGARGCLEQLMSDRRSNTAPTSEP